MNLTPKQIVEQLDKNIVGQYNAKKAVAIALRNRIRRMNVSEDLRNEISPKNILMIGPTGVGKTEIARRLATLVGAPFIKIEATKFTEVGYVGKDVDSIIRDLVEISYKNQRKIEIEKNKIKAVHLAEEKILDLLLPPARNTFDEPIAEETSTRGKFREKLLAGELDDKEIEIEISQKKNKLEFVSPQNMEEITNQLQSMFEDSNKAQTAKKKLTVKNALEILIEQEAECLIDNELTKQEALRNVEQNGIVFLDEIDKVAIKNNSNSADVSRSGVQRDLLPLVEGTTVNTKYGMIKTDHILFIASGAFHIAKPSDLLPELQGRFPIRVELNPLTQNDFRQILTNTEANLIKQYSALLATDNINIEVTDEAINQIAEYAYNLNQKNENIGARRLSTVLEKILEDISFDIEKYQNTPVQITLEFVQERLGNIVQSEDLAKYIL